MTGACHLHHSFLYLLHPSLIVVVLSSPVGKEGESAPNSCVYDVDEEGRIYAGGMRVKY